MSVGMSVEDAKPVFRNTGFSVLNSPLGSKSGTAYCLALCKGHVDRRVLGVLAVRIAHS